jgi:Fis family transcriptional regulator
MTITTNELISNELVACIASLEESVSSSVRQYFQNLNGESPIDLKKFVIEEMEPQLLTVVMQHCKYNQSKAAAMLGLSRGTLRAKLRYYFDDKYVGER